MTGWASIFKEGLVQALGSCIFIIFSGDATRHPEVTKEGKWVGANGGSEWKWQSFPFFDAEPDRLD